MVFRKKTKKAPETAYFEERERPMGEAQEMRNLTQEIADSFDTRVARVAALRRETAAKLKDAEASRKRDFRAMHQRIQSEQEARSREVGGMLSGARQLVAGFRRDHQAAASHWRSMTATMERKRASAAR